MFPKTVTDSLTESVVTQTGQLNAEERLQLFLMYCQTAKQVWALKGESGFVMLESEQGPILPVWPHKDLVALWAEYDAANAEPEMIELSMFTGTWLPGLEANNTRLSVFPLGAGAEEMVLTAKELEHNWANEDE